ncbi:hypothetical protein D0N36_03740 [Hymenobacter lapidiphilus]|uniref:hypothetical protein n=1 Tax=Hymenobacter sp. CCM 8763 TaxID=2303334 RepID=UPI000E343BA2|nr:hypothetical protein [Hymenobacter sp. CCM 8763]RFP66470.1 hypothetical protein D0N36_03740 [Hymenobacter sp. CCM 8763]
MLKSLLLIGVLLFAVDAYSQRPSPAFKPACDLKRLNEEYAKLLYAKRRLVNPKAKLVVFDVAMLSNATLHNKAMDERDKLYHSDQAKSVELIGMSTEFINLQRDPKRIAEHIWTIFNSSFKGHCEAQEDGERYRIAISCSQKYFVVRMQPIPVMYGY